MSPDVRSSLANRMGAIYESVTCHAAPCQIDWTKLALTAAGQNCKVDTVLQSKKPSALNQSKARPFKTEFRIKNGIPCTVSDRPIVIRITIRHQRLPIDGCVQQLPIDGCVGMQQLPCLSRMDGPTTRAAASQLSMHVCGRHAGTRLSISMCCGSGIAAVALQLACPSAVPAVGT